MNKRAERAGSMKNLAVILRLAGTAILALLWARSYAGFYNNLMRIHEGFGRTVIIIIGMLLDSLLTVLWLKSKILFNLHFAAFVLVGGWFNITYLLDVFAVYGDGIGILIIWICGALMTLPQFIPFIIYTMYYTAEINARNESAAHSEQNRS